MGHPRYILAHQTDICSNITNATYFSAPFTPPALARRLTYLLWYTTRWRVVTRVGGPRYHATHRHAHVTNVTNVITKSDNTEKEKQFAKKISLNKKHWRKATLKEQSTVLQLRKRVKLLFPSQHWHTHILTRLETAHHDQAHPKSNHPNSQKNGEKVPL